MSQLKNPSSSQWNGYFVKHKANSQKEFRIMFKVTSTHILGLEETQNHSRRFAFLCRTSKLGVAR